MESKKINQLATELAPDLSDLTIIGDPTTGISKKITLSQMASLFTGTVEEYANLAAFPLVGVADTIYIALDTNVIYRYDTSLSAYVILSPNIINSLVFSDANGFDGTITLVGSVATLSITTALTLGSVPFIGASGALTQDNSNLFFDDTNNRLGIATASPTTPLDVFGSGIIGRLNATSTNNAYLGFASNGTNKWSAGNVQSDHRFRIFSEANSAELITILQTGEFGIGIANPLTKLHIDGGATALIANLDANVSVAKSVSYRSDNSSRINLEVSGTESGSNAGADFFLRTFTDAGSLLATPLTITRSTGAITLTGALSSTFVGQFLDNTGASILSKFIRITNTGADMVIGIEGSTPSEIASADGGIAYSTVLKSVGSTSLILGTLSKAALTINTSQQVTLTQNLSGTTASFTNTITAGAFNATGSTIPANGMYLSAANTLNFATNTTNRLSISSTGAATFTSAAGITNGNGLNLRAGGNTASDANVLNFTSLAGTINVSMFSDASSSNTRLKSLGNLSFHTGNIAISADNERMTILANGRVGINTTAPDARLEVQLGNGNVSAGLFYNYTGDVTATLLISRCGTTSGFYHFQAFSTTTTEVFRIESNGNAKNTNNSYGSLSDIKIKDNVTDATPKLVDLLKVRIRNYNIIGQDVKQIGVIAQELEEIFPSMVDENEDFEEIKKINKEGNSIIEKKSLGTFTKGVKYSVFVPILIKAIQEQQEQIEELKALINK